MPTLSFDLISMSTFSFNVDNRERARARDKSQRRPISFEEKQKNLIVAVRKRENASCYQGENERQPSRRIPGPLRSTKNFPSG